MALERGKKSLLWATGIAWAALLCVAWTPQSPYFRHWEILRDGPVAFRPLTRLEMAACGDLGRNSHVGQLQHWRRIRFTTDELGLRNGEDSSWAREVVVGDSFVVGSGVDDAETIPAGMARALGEPVTNYGCVAGLGPLAYLADPRSRESPPEIVVWAPAYRTMEPVPLGLAIGARPPAENDSPTSHAPSLLRRVQAGFRAWESVGGSVRAWKSRAEESSWLVDLARSMFHETYWRLAGHPWEIQSIEVDGDCALVLPLEAQGLLASPQARRLEETVKSIVRFHREVTARGSRFAFAPVPDAGTIYPDLYPETERSRLASPAFIDLIFRELAARGIASIDLRPTLRQDRFPYLFLRDDTHLAPRGTELVARKLAEAVRVVLASAQTR